MKSVFRFKRAIVTVAAVAVLVPFSAQPRVQAQPQDIVDTAVAAARSRPSRPRSRPPVSSTR